MERFPENDKTATAITDDLWQHHFGAPLGIMMDREKSSSDAVYDRKPTIFLHKTTSWRISKCWTFWKHCVSRANRGTRPVRLNNPYGKTFADSWQDKHGYYWKRHNDSNEHTTASCEKDTADINTTPPARTELVRPKATEKTEMQRNPHPLLTS